MINSTVLNKAVNNVQGDHSSLRSLSGFDENVYEVKIQNESFIMKFYLASQNNRSLIQGELDWINYLFENGLKVAKPVFSPQNNLIEEISDNGLIYYCVIFEKVEGDFIADLGWDKELIQQWGRSMGKMHNLAKDYRSGKAKVINWAENDIIIEPPQIASTTVLERWDYYKAKLRNLPTSKECFGIIHNDLHHKNIFFNNGKVRLFDFGDIEYGWFIYDIAISLYHALQGISFTSEKDRLDFAYKFLSNFIEGYTLENKITEEWIYKIELFLDYRQIYSYLYFLKYLDIDDISGGVKEVLDEMKYRIENNISYLQSF